MKHCVSETMEGAALMQRIEEMKAEHEQRIVAHLSREELRALIDYLETHDRLAHTHLAQTTVAYIHKRIHHPGNTL